MGRRAVLLVVLTGILVLAFVGAAQQSSIAPAPGNLAQRLGYPTDAKLLIIHADDIGVSHSADRASFDALKRVAATSGSIMVPCPWFPEVVSWARENPEADLGIHFTLTAEWTSYRWGPLAPRDQVASLLDPSGYLWLQAGPVAKARPEEVEKEMRAQVEMALKSGIPISHFDSHMGTVFTPPMFPIYVKLAREYRVPFFCPRAAATQPFAADLLKQDDPLMDAMAMVNANVKPEAWPAFYEDVLRNLKPGLTYLIVHLGYNDAELQAVMTEEAPFAAAWRQRDFDVLTSAAFARAIKDNGVTLVGWKDIKKLMK